MTTTNLPVPEYAAVRHILTSPSLQARSAPHIREDDFDWVGLLVDAEQMSGGEQTMIRIAHDLWNAEPLAGIWEIPNRLDRGHFERVIEALYLYRGEPRHGRLVALRDLPRAA
jgi:hypothetical protein